MPLEPRVRRLVALSNVLDRGGPGPQTILTQREASAAQSHRLGFLAMAHGPKMVEEVDRLIPVAGGQIRVRIHRPRRSGAPLPLYLFVHGGGWCLGTLEERDPRCREIASGADCIVASVEYRLAPENAYPVATEDCYAALVWLHDHAEELGIDSGRIAIGGESAGGNLAAVVCLMARDRGGPALCHQWLDVPAVDLTLAQPAFSEVPDGYLLDRDAVLEFRELYLVDVALDHEPYASPLLASSHEGLPPAWIMSAEFDKLRDDGKAYAAALEAAGVPVEYQMLRGHIHGSFAFTRMIASAKAYEVAAIAALAKAFANA